MATAGTMLSAKTDITVVLSKLGAPSPVGITCGPGTPSGGSTLSSALYGTGFVILQY